MGEGGGTDALWREGREAQILLLARYPQPTRPFQHEVRHEGKFFVSLRGSFKMGKS